ncbi:MAG: Lrp/AsnC ligand binding domain-containing protein [Candidatus Hodarchaeota archaeon]
MRNKLLINIIIANLLWSFIPVVVSGLFLEVSIIMVIFIRFLIAGIFLFIFAIFLAFYNNNFTKNSKISILVLIKNIFHRNRRFYSIKNFFYYWLIGFIGIVLHIIFFFLMLKTTSVTFAMASSLLTVIFIAIYEKGVRFEKFDIFKVLYIIMLIFSILVLIYVAVIGQISKGGTINFNSFIYLILNSITTAFLYISIDRDAYSKKEADNISLNKYYKFPRLLIKMGVSFILGILSMIPFIWITTTFFFSPELRTESITFFTQLLEFFKIVGRWEIIYLIIFSTIFPYVLIFTANVNWKSENLTYSQWNSILNLIDPLGSILFSVFLINEFFPLELLVILIFLLFVTIIFRYAHEVKNLVKAYLLIKVKSENVKTTILKILKYYGVNSIYALIGTYDLLINVKTNSIRDLYYLVNNRLKPINEIKKIEILFINKTEKLPI